MPERSTAATKTIRHLKEMLEKPANLSGNLSEWSKNLKLDPVVTVSEFLKWLRSDTDQPHVKSAFHTMLALWDYRPDFPWVNATEPSTRARRNLIYGMLGLSPAEQVVIDKLFPVYPKIDQPIAITAQDPGQQTWYDQERRDQTVFYWKSYETYLVRKKWDPKNIAVLDSSSTDVVSDLRDPQGRDDASNRGLVVGYVQSGKTANFTGVIAKAMDAGYRLVIVLAGLQNSLRNQTQRRIDKELVGSEVLGITGEYVSDDDWSEFNSHGDLPTRMGWFEIDRLTTSIHDFRNPIGDLTRLRFHKADKSLPFNHPTNLERHPVKLVVIKKNKVPLTNLLRALKESQAAGSPWSEVPSLIIDDESDQASLNSKKPDKAEQKKRTTINGLIVDILSVLKRGQYVGYTATPFANVFVSPDDADDLFPRDFLLSLPRPEGYMGVKDFYDAPEATKTATDPHTNYGRHVRPVEGEDGKPGNLPGAMDAFVLSGAIKLFRQSQGKRKYKHHTMLVHLTTSVRDHKTLKAKIDLIFSEAGYATDGPGFNRLKELWEKDFQPICGNRANSDDPVPPSFEALRKFIGPCVARIGNEDGCTLILNGTETENPPDFDKTSVWKIIVGGAKLSRGYTVEGLTVSYYRRVAGAADTLMQMGRWFGYREGYRDLVRLYIGVNEAKNKTQTIDLYEAFRGVCDDEEEFRSTLSKYSRLSGEERLTPKQIPPLVPSHMLLPTAKNKMYNATVLFLNFGGDQKQSTVASSDPEIKQANEKAMKRLLKSANVTQATLSSTKGSERTEFGAFCGLASSDDMRKFLHAYKFGPTVEDQGQLPLIREFIEGEHGNPGIEQWAVVAPQFASDSKGASWNVPGIGNLSVLRRERVGDGHKRYNVYTESRHVDLATVLTGVSKGKAANAATRKLAVPRTAVMLVYPVLAKDEAGAIPTMGFSLLFPNNAIKRKIKYGVRVKNRPSDVIVDVAMRKTAAAGQSG